MAAVSRERVALHPKRAAAPLTALGAWDAPPLNRLEVTIEVLRLYIFAMRLLVLKYIACQVVTDTGAWDGGEPPTASCCTLNRIEGAWDALPLNRLDVTVAESQSLTPCKGIDLR